MVTLRVNEEYRTLDEFVIRAKTTASTQTRTRTDSAWTGCDFDTALALALDGWTEGVERIKPLASRVSDRVASHLEVTDWGHDVEPGNLDIARFIDGEPECWLTPSVRHIVAQGRLLTVVLGGGISAGYSAEAIFARGSAVVALVDCLERAGHSVRLVWDCATQGKDRDDRAAVKVVLKTWGEALHLGRVAFAFAHPGMLRLLYFAIQDGWTKENQDLFDIAGGRGRPAPPAEYAGALVLREMHLGNTPEDLEKWVLDQLKAQGIELREEARP